MRNRKNSRFYLWVSRTRAAYVNVLIAYVLIIDRETINVMRASKASPRSVNVRR